MGTTEDRIKGIICSDAGLFDFLIPIAIGEPIGPDGNVYEYGDHDLSLWVHDLLFDAQGRDVLAREATNCHRVLALADRLNAEAVLNLTPEDWARVRDGLIRKGWGRTVPCGYCADRINCTEEAFAQHYREAKCWAGKQDPL